ncbi:MAG: hypothetical protein QM579_11615 [Desulfovibrio sp.]|uniref:hypothetical protein n=1 Tax=Desulfovibrio sp. TaxID=885 RepID=UPI0039E5054C
MNCRRHGAKPSRRQALSGHRRAAVPACNKLTAFVDLHGLPCQYHHGEGASPLAGF